MAIGWLCGAAGKAACTMPARCVVLLTLTFFSDMSPQWPEKMGLAAKSREPGTQEIRPTLWTSCGVCCQGARGGDRCAPTPAKPCLTSLRPADTNPRTPTHPRAQASLGGRLEGKQCSPPGTVVGQTCRRLVAFSCRPVVSVPARTP